MRLLHLDDREDDDRRQEHDAGVERMPVRVVGTGRGDGNDDDDDDDGGDDERAKTYCSRPIGPWCRC